MSIVCAKYANVKPSADFDWSVYDDGWNGKSLMTNKRVKTQDNKTKVFCHEKYATSALKKYNHQAGDFDDGVKDLTEGGIIRIKDMKLLSKNELLLSTSTGGSAIVNLTKEAKFFERFNIDKETFKNDYILNEIGKMEFLADGNLAKIGKNGFASLYEGTLIKLEQDFAHQAELGDKATAAYLGKIIASNKGGYIMDVQGIKCFLPGSQATSNKLQDFESLVGTEMEVMIMNNVPGSGFIVSRKKFLDRMRPAMIDRLREEWEKDPEKIYHGTVTGARHFGIFIELNEYYTGLAHRIYLEPETLSKILPIEGEDADANAKRNYPQGTPIDVKIYKVDDSDHIVFTDIMDKSKRDELVAERERIEEEAEAAAKAEALAQKKIADEIKRKKMMSKADNNFKGETISLEDLRK